MKTRLQSRFTRVDIAALLAFVALWIYYIVIVRYGQCYPDESQFLSVAQRFVNGDRPLVDDWHLAQLPNLFLCPAYSVYVAVKGSTDGILLFMRYLFVALNAVVYWFIYCRLRAYRRLSVVTALLFCAYIPAGIFSWFYYTASIRLLMLACLLLFSEKQKTVSLILAGVLLSCAVIYQPGFALLYVFFTVLVWVRFFRKKKAKLSPDDFAFCLNLRAWAIISLSVLLCAAVLLGFLLWKSGLRNILETVPYMLLTDPEYDFSAEGNAWSVFFRKLGEALSVYGAACIAAAIALLVLSAVYACGAFRARRAQAQRLLFCCACAVWIWSCVPSFRLLGGTMLFAGIFFKLYPAPLFWLGLVCFLLCDQKNRRFLFFWVVSLFASIGIDLTSELALSVGAPISNIADLVFFTDLLREVRADHPVKNKTDAVRSRKKMKRIDRTAQFLARLACACFAVWFALAAVRDNALVCRYYLQHDPLVLSPFVCEAGPAQGVRYPAANGVYYGKTLADIDTLKKTQPKNLFIYGMAPELYLYADLPYAAYDAWTWRNEAYLQRCTLYWTQHPERQPACIYAPFFEAYESVNDDDFSAEEFLSRLRERFDPLCTYTAVRGQGGYILYVSRWHLNGAVADQ